MATNLTISPSGGEGGASESEPLVRVRLDDRVLGVPLARTREVVMLGSVTPIPFAPAKVRGAVNLGGRMATVIDLRAALGLPAREASGPDVGLGIEVDEEAVRGKLSEGGWENPRLWHEDGSLADW